MAVSRESARRLVAMRLGTALLIASGNPAAAQLRQHSAPASAEDLGILRLPSVPLAKLALPGRTSATLVAMIRPVPMGSIEHLTSWPTVSGLGPLSQIVWDDGSRPLGQLSPVRYGGGAMTLVSKPFGGRWRPYAGAGLSYHFEKRRTPLRNFEVKDSLGPVIETGLEFQMLRDGRLFADAKKGFFKSSVMGEVQGMRSNTASRYDPFILTAGAAVRF